MVGHMPRTIADLLAGTTIPALTQAKLLSIMHPEFFNDPRNERELHAALAGVDWEWPWHAEWAEQFAAIGALPRMWRKPGADQRLALLTHTAAMYFFDAGRRERAARVGTLGWVQFCPVRDEPAAVQAIIDAYIADYAAGSGPAPLPPIFPGDRTMVHCWPINWPSLERRRASGAVFYKLRPLVYDLGFLPR
jgi:hypothetical protein